jgi:hypothetical protein
VREPVLYEVLLNRAAEELEREKTARLRSCSDSLVGELGEVFSRLLAEAYKRGVVDGFAQGAAAQTEAQR